MRFAIGVGGNIGDVPAAATSAATGLEAAGVAIVARSGWHRTAAAGADGPPFLNAAWIVETGLGAHGLLCAMLAAETAQGRIRSRRWGPRTLDLDLLLAEDGSRVDSAVLSLPHPRLHLRAFVLAPLREIAPGWVHPRFGCPVADLPLPGCASA